MNIPDRDDIVGVEVVSAERTGRGSVDAGHDAGPAEQMGARGDTDTTIGAQSLQTQRTLLTVANIAQVVVGHLPRSLVSLEHVIELI